MNRALAVVTTLLGFLTTQPAFSVQDESLLEQGSRLSQGLDGREKLYYLVELCRVSAQRQPPAVKAKEWCTELYDVASTEQDAKLRSVAQKNAIAFLSYVDAPRSVELLTQVSFQRPKPGEFVYEDPRYNAAEKTFRNYLRARPGDLNAITPKAKFLGQTGQFPYRAIATLIDEFSKQLGGEINAIVRDAVAAYATETGFYNRDEEFLTLLQALSRSKAIDPDVVAQAAAAFVHHLQTDPVQSPGDYYGEVHLELTGKVIPFTNRNAAFFFQALPAIQHSNPSLAAQLIQEDSNLAQAVGAMQYISGGFVQGDPTAIEATQQHSEWLQESLVSRIQQCQISNPESATRLAQRLSNPESRILGFSGVIQGMARRNKPRRGPFTKSNLWS